MNYTSTDRPTLLALDDTVEFHFREQDTFTTLRYKVRPHFLGCMGVENNQRIFHSLGIVDRMEFASECYGYPTRNGGWPVCAGEEDYPALTRLANALLDLCALSLTRPVNDSQSMLTNQQANFPVMIQQLLGTSIPFMTSGNLPETLVPEDLAQFRAYLAEVGMNSPSREEAEYLIWKSRGVTISVAHSLESHYVAELLKFFRDAHRSIPLDSALAAFPGTNEADHNHTIHMLHQEGFLRTWSGGTYIRAEKRSEADRLIRAAGLRVVPRSASVERSHESSSF